MKVVKKGRKWFIEGNGNGWIFNRSFPTKWKAEIALEVFKEGGRVSDYYWRIKEKAPPKRKPWRVIKKLEILCEKIKELRPTCDEIVEFAENIADYGQVTYTDDDNYFGPRVHDTWLKKLGGRVHIDIGCRGYHLMLDKNVVETFIDFIENRRRRSSK